MIDFRYHLVSIVAIFLALTVGIVLGSTVLEPTFYKSAEDMTASLRQANEKYITQISDLQSREEGADSLIVGHTADLVRGQLAGERVVLVEAPGAPAGLRDSIQRLVTDAGAVYTGRVSLTDKFTAGDQAAVVDGLATNVAPVGTKFPDGASAYDKAAAMLASAIVTGDRTQAGRPNPAATGVLEAFQAGDFLTINGSPAQRATLAIVLTPAQPYEGEEAETQTAAIVSIAAGLDSADLGTVVAGNTTASAGAGVIAALHDTGEAASNVTTVDTVDIPAGRITIVYALREQLAGRSGAYGIGSGSTAFEPSVVASPTPSTAASTAATRG
ncbi:copper transporter [Microbispora sp. RL4-1S]|uniref:Copper transporter n=1 Tax=Microbispora oryzae TaxID=2806554 RepID=A0A940WL25_9ACTN|nr:copper transporter [Microbispora oryzae]MBP2703455.1 copper transporter [Microbispora oryzae]